MPQSSFGIFKLGLLFGRFLKNFSWSPLALFQKMRVLGNLAKFAITWPFGQVWIRLLRQNLVQSLHFKCILVRLLFRRFLKNFLWSPLYTFLENAGFALSCQNCHNLVIRAGLEPLFSPKSSPVLAL